MQVYPPPSCYLIHPCFDCQTLHLLRALLSPSDAAASQPPSTCCSQPAPAETDSLPRLLAAAFKLSNPSNPRFRIASIRHSTPPIPLVKHSSAPCVGSRPGDRSSTNTSLPVKGLFPPFRMEIVGKKRARARTPPTGLFFYGQLRNDLPR